MWLAHHARVETCTERDRVLGQIFAIYWIRQGFCCEQLQAKTTLRLDVEVSKKCPCLTACASQRRQPGLLAMTHMRYGHRGRRWLRARPIDEYSNRDAAPSCTWRFKDDAVRRRLEATGRDSWRTRFGPSRDWHVDLRGCPSSRPDGGVCSDVQGTRATALGRHGHRWCCGRCRHWNRSSEPDTDDEEEPLEALLEATPTKISHMSRLLALRLVYGTPIMTDLAKAAALDSKLGTASSSSSSALRK